MDIQKVVPNPWQAWRRKGEHPLAVVVSANADNVRYVEDGRSSASYHKTSDFVRDFEYVALAPKVGELWRNQRGPARSINIVGVCLTDCSKTRGQPCGAHTHFVHEGTATEYWSYLKDFVNVYELVKPKPVVTGAEVNKAFYNAWCSAVALPVGAKDPYLELCAGDEGRGTKPVPSPREQNEAFLRELRGNPPAWARLAGGKTDPRYYVVLANAVEALVGKAYRRGDVAFHRDMKDDLRTYVSVEPSYKLPEGKAFTPRLLRTR